MNNLTTLFLLSLNFIAGVSIFFPIDFLQSIPIENANITVLTDRDSYKFGDNLTVTIRNDSNETISFGNRGLGLSIVNNQTGQTVSIPLVFAAVLTHLPGGQSSSITVPLNDSNGAFDEGSYIVSVKPLPLMIHPPVTNASILITSR